MVSAPLVEYLHRDNDVAINICSHIKEESDKLASRYSGVQSTYLEVKGNNSNMRGLIEESDIVVSLLPYGLHADVAKQCVETKTHMVTASYVTDGVRELHDEYVLINHVIVY